MIHFFVPSEPKAQPRALHCVIRGKPRTYNPKSADAWKRAVAPVAKRHALMIQGPVAVRMDFYFKCKGKRKDSWHVSRPDVDNLQKAVLDAMTGCGFWKDDAQVCAGSVNKRWSETKEGVEIQVVELDAG